VLYVRVTGTDLLIAITESCIVAPNSPSEY
jgi:hypothetical protein